MSFGVFLAGIGSEDPRSDGAARTRMSPDNPPGRRFGARLFRVGAAAEAGVAQVFNLLYRRF